MPDGAPKRYSFLGRRSLFWKIYLAMIASLVTPFVIFALRSAYVDSMKNTEEGLRGDRITLEWVAEIIANQTGPLKSSDIEADLAKISRPGIFEIFVRDGGRILGPDTEWRRQLIDGTLPPVPSGPLVARASSSDGRREAFMLRNLRPPYRHGGEEVHVVGFIAVAISGAVISFLILRGLMTPINELRHMTKRLAEGDFTVRADESMLAQSSEIADLGASFNWMAEGIETVLSSQMRLLIDISHELRSPLQRMDVALTLARRVGIEKAGEHLDRVEREIERIDEMIEELLTLTDPDTTEAGCETLRLDEIVLAAADDARYTGAIDGKRVSVSTEPIEVCGAASLTKRAISSVLENAMRYAPPDSEVSIAVRRDGEGGTAVIEIADTGPGVPDDELDKIFMPYYRTDESRLRSKGGHGLGLAITKRTIEGMGGRVCATNRELGGLRVKMTIPIKR